MSKRLTTSEFIDRSQKLHNFNFDYSLTNYINNHTKVIIICQIHGEFFQRPLSHLSGIGCKKCGVDKRIKARSSTIDIFIKNAIAVHGNKYDYSKVKYKNARSHVDIFCKNCNKIFSQKAYVHMGGHGCPKCNIGISPGWTKTEWIKLCNSKKSTPLVYIIRCYNDDEEFVKIGITSKSVQERFYRKNTMPYSYEILKEIKGSPDFVFDKEVELHRQFKQYKYKPLISFGGETECFNTLILNDLKFNC